MDLAAPPTATAPPASAAPSACAAGNRISGDVTVRQQSDIDRLAGCQAIDGSLSITFDTDLDLRPLAALQVIEGRLDVLPGIDARGEALSVRLSSLHGLEALRAANTLLLVGIDGGLQPLSALSGDINEVVLSSLKGVRDLQALHGVRVTEHLAVESMPDLESLSGATLAPDFGTLSVRDAPQLASLEGLEGLTGLEVLELRGVAALDRLSFPDSLASLSNVFIEGAGELATLAELSRFSTIQLLDVGNSPRLRDLGGASPGANSLTQLTVYSCPLLTALDPVGGLSSLVSVAIQKCDGLTEVDGLAASATLQSLLIKENAALTHLPVFPLVEGEMVEVNIQDNPALITGPSFPQLSVLHNFESLFYESAELLFVGNPVLESIGDFSNLRSLSMLTLENNPALTTVSLPAVSSLVWLRVRDNARLARLELELQDGLQLVELVDNPALAELKLGLPSQPLRLLDLQGNGQLSAEAEQQLLDLVGPETTSSLD